MTETRWACLWYWKQSVQTQDLLEQLQRFSPEVEAHPSENGVFWLNAQGLETVFQSMQAWAKQLHQTLSPCSLVVGFSRFASYLICKSLHGKLLYLNQVEEEHTYLNHLSLEHLGLSNKELRFFRKLGVHDIAEFMALPKESLTSRFSAQVRALHDWATGELALPLQAAPPCTKLEAQIELLEADDNSERLLFALKGALSSVIEQARHQQKGIYQLDLELSCENRQCLFESLRPAQACLDQTQFLQLIYLKLQSINLPDKVFQIRLIAHGTRLYFTQTDLFSSQPKRDLNAANRALARIRTQFGAQSIRYAVLKNTHLPENRFYWNPLENLKKAEPQAKTSKQMLRRFYPEARPTAPPPLCKLKHYGPHRLHGGWWGRGIKRDYYFICDAQQHWQWCFYDYQTRTWYVQGELQ